VPLGGHNEPGRYQTESVPQAPVGRITEDTDVVTDEYHYPGAEQQEKQHSHPFRRLLWFGFWRRLPGPSLGATLWHISDSSRGCARCRPAGPPGLRRLGPAPALWRRRGPNRIPGAPGSPDPSSRIVGGAVKMQCARVGHHVACSSRSFVTMGTKMCSSRRCRSGSGTKTNERDNFSP
jgi:hypothetical protein